MSQAYSDPKRETNPYALPDVEVFFVSPMEAQYNRDNADHGNEYTIYESGWYYWFCLPGCLPHSEAFGPFETKDAALENV